VAAFLNREAKLVALLWLYQGGYDAVLRANIRRSALKVLSATAVWVGFGAMSFWVAKTPELLLSSGGFPQFSLTGRFWPNVAGRRAGTPALDY
jgi:hypothetical protein